MSIFFTSQTWTERKRSPAVSQNSPHLTTAQRPMATTTMTSASASPRLIPSSQSNPSIHLLLTKTDPPTTLSN